MQHNTSFLSLSTKALPLCVILLLLGICYFDNFAHHFVLGVSFYDWEVGFWFLGCSILLFADQRQAFFKQFSIKFPNLELHCGQNCPWGNNLAQNGLRHRVGIWNMHFVGLPVNLNFLESDLFFWWYEWVPVRISIQERS